ncbi:A disintegrin and metallopeptidase domain 3-like [Ailuropoda melanoleuca]|uniref:A disintegrin and metallopeptidase domain 3-like n=1 Tax=Ailuropoda melanoleuca TaxID=9646 RepID=UPI001494B979|nr:A disintegrin and metallopeptidase domain 3-like [Ailuropoda melanoleuca]
MNALGPLILALDCPLVFGFLEKAWSPGKKHWCQIVLSFLDPHFLVYAYNKSGTLYPDSSFIKRHCLYQGYAAEVPKSVVTLSTCSGLRGLLLLQNVSYGIEPLESAAAYEHMLYQTRNNKIDFSPVQENYPTPQGRSVLQDSCEIGN